MAPITNSLVFRLFDDKALRMRAVTVMITVGMSGFVLGPLLGGTALAQVGWERLLVVNAPLASIIGAAGALAAFVRHERRSPAPMLDLGLFSNGTVRGATIAQAGTAIAMASVMFGLILHFQYAYGWSPVRAGLANLPIIVTMLVATPLS